MASVLTAPVLALTGASLIGTSALVALVSKDTDSAAVFACAGIGCTIASLMLMWVNRQTPRLTERGTQLYAGAGGLRAVGLCQSVESVDMCGYPYGYCGDIDMWHIPHLFDDSRVRYFCGGYDHAEL